METRGEAQLGPPCSSIDTPGMGKSEGVSNRPLGTTLLSLKTLPEMKPNVLTVSVAFTADWLLPRLVCSAPTGMVLVWTPAAVAVTSTLMVQPPAGICWPLA